MKEYLKNIIKLVFKSLLNSLVNDITGITINQKTKTRPISVAQGVRLHNDIVKLEEYKAMSIYEVLNIYCGEISDLDLIKGNDHRSIKMSDLPPGEYNIPISKTANVQCNWPDIIQKYINGQKPVTNPAIINYVVYDINIHIYEFDSTMYADRRRFYELTASATYSTTSNPSTTYRVALYDLGISKNMSNGEHGEIVWKKLLDTDNNNGTLDTDNNNGTPISTIGWS